MNDLTRALLADARLTAREQLGQILEGRMTALTAGIEQALTESLAGARRELADKLNQAVRRLRSAENHEQWSNTLIESTRGFCGRAALFTLEGESLHHQASRNVAGAAPRSNVPLNAAPAFASAVESGDTVVAMRTQGEMSQALAWLGTDESRKFYVLPIVKHGQVIALLYADADDREVESSALELLTAVAGAVFEPRVSKAPADLVTIVNARPKPAPEQQELHSRAQRFARHQAAEIRLYKSDEVKKGRTARDVYTSLKIDIDSARETFRRDFLSASPAMTDYLHLELVRTLANNDVELLGPYYPGPLA